MKKKILALNILALSVTLSAQVLTTVDNGGYVTIMPGALMYNGGGINVNNTGVIDVYGNVQISGVATDVVTTATTNGGRINLKLNTSVPNFASYGQLQIDGISQGNITGVVSKEYRDNRHGDYQQVALPFYQKTIGSLNTEVPQLGLTDVRFVGGKASGKNALLYRNDLVREDLKTLNSLTTNPYDYYVIGTKNITDVTYFPTNTSTINGRPSATGNVLTLVDAGKNVYFGTYGDALNYHGQRYYSYLYDAWDASTNLWTGDFGRNIYQFGNPYLMNLDLSALPPAFISKVKGIRYETSNTATNLSNASHSVKMLNFNASGKPIGDVNSPLIKPMQEFVIKLRDNSGPKLNFDNLRTFSFTPATQATASKSSNSADNVKQIGVIGLDANGTEIGRTYFAVYPQAISGLHSGYSAQATTTSRIIGTYEEDKNGGVDAGAAELYWMYINEANETDFQGKRLSLYTYGQDIKSLKFEIREDAKELAEGQSQLSTNKSFYIAKGSNEKQVVSNGQIIDISDVAGSGSALAKEFGLYYGDLDKTLGSDNASLIAKTVVAKNVSTNGYEIVFSPKWKLAKVDVFDMSGKSLASYKNIATTSNFRLPTDLFPNGSYIVRVESENGEVALQKIIK